MSKGPFRGLLHFSNSSMSNQAMRKGPNACFPEIVESNGPLDAVGRPRLAIVSLLVRPEARLPHLPD